MTLATLTPLEFLAYVAGGLLLGGLIYLLTDVKPCQRQRRRTREEDHD